MAVSEVEPKTRSFVERIGRVLLFVLFALLLLIPRALRLRRRRRLWTALRAWTALAGALLFAQGIGSPPGGAKLFAGVLLITLAAAVRPARTGQTLDDLKETLGGLVAVNGGILVAQSGPPQRVHLIVGATRLHVVSLGLEPLEQLPLKRLSSLRVEPLQQGWQLTLRSAGRELAFRYEGAFAEHLARVAENTIRSLHQPEPPVLE